MVAGRFALCQTMPLDRSLAAAEALRPSGYRPACFRPYPVGKAVQVFDVYGNVWEWCQDHRSDVVWRGSKGQPHPDWEPVNRLIQAYTSSDARGGSFLDPAGRLRSAYHNSGAVTYRSRDYGLRLARTVRRAGPQWREVDKDRKCCNQGPENASSRQVFTWGYFGEGG